MRFSLGLLLAALTMSFTPAAAGGPTAPRARIVAEISAQTRPEFSMVGVTWRNGYPVSQMTVEVRLRQDGHWTNWRELHVDESSAGGDRSGTEPLWVGSADGVEVRVRSPSGRRPDGLKIAAIAAPNVSQDLGAAQVSAAGVDGSPRFIKAPAIITRKAWKAAPAKKCDKPLYGSTTLGAMMHHTAGTNQYSRKDAIAYVRALQRFNQVEQGWCDLGYNFLIDKYGRIFEGRAGGVDHMVRAAHAGNAAASRYTMGVALIGDFETQEPTAAAKAALVRLIGWRLATFYVPAKGTYALDGNSLERISGHRDVVGTICPGQAAYDWMEAPGGLRDRVEAYIARYSSPLKDHVLKLGAAATGPIFVGESGNKRKRTVQTRAWDFLYKQGRGAHGVTGKVRKEYRRLGSQKGSLKFPKSDLKRSKAKRVKIQRFEKGSIYLIKRPKKVIGIWGKIDKRYRKLGGPAGRLGIPKTRPKKLGRGVVRVAFKRGVITQSKSGAVKVAYQRR